MSYTDEQIACVVHQANCGLQYIQDDPSPSQPWWAETDETRQSAISGVREARLGRTPRHLHESWCIWKKEHGWRYGPVKDPQAKTHPCLVDYGRLPEQQKIKDRLFIAIVAVMDSS